MRIFSRAHLDLKRALLPAVFVLAASGCHTQERVVRARAAHDLGCTAEEVQAERIAGTTWEAWCPQSPAAKATYTCGSGQQGGTCVREHQP